MVQYNRARRLEWVEAQKKLEADELATARLAYIKGTATEEQMLLVEEANREALEKGVKLPSLLGAPEHRTHFEEHIKPAFHGEQKEKRTGKGILGIFSSSKEEEATSSTISTFPTDAAHTIEDKAKQAWDKEKQNQGRGGSLDQLGLEKSVPAKRGWWPW